MSEFLTQKETKREKFVRLGEKRVNTILEEFRKLGNLSNKRNYEYSDDDVKKMFLELGKALRKTREFFSDNSPSRQKKFKL